MLDPAPAPPPQPPRPPGDTEASAVAPSSAAAAPSSASASASSSSSSSSSSSDLSAYEKARLAQIAANEAYMRSIGLGSARAAAQASAVPARRASKRTRKKARSNGGHDVAALAAAQPRRRSKRLRNAPASSSGGGGGSSSSSSSSASSGAYNDEPAEEALPFDDSKVATYDAYVDDAAADDDNDGNAAGAAAPVVPPVAVQTSSSTASTRPLQRLKEVAGPFQDESLKKIYTLAFSPDATLLAAAGHQGRATVFGASGARAGDVLLSFKAHSGWVASAHFLRGGTAGAAAGSSAAPSNNLLLTAANDAVVTVWDLRKVLAVGSNARPRKVHSVSNLHSNGIFCADVRGAHLATASKDKTVAFCAIAQGEVRRVRSLGGLHAGVVKCVSLRDAAMLASTGNDTDVCVCDVRQAARAGLVARFADTHRLAVNHVSWNPARPNELMTASFGNKIKLWDLRKAGGSGGGGGAAAAASAKPLRVLQGHAMLFDGQRGGIYHPLYTGNGRYVVTPGSKTDAVTIFDAADGTLVSKGSLSVGEVASMASCDARGSRLAAARGGRVVLLDPVWGGSGAGTVE